MIAKNNEILTSATESLYRFNSNDLIREQCEARMEYERHERTIQRRLAEQEATIREQANAIREKDSAIEEQANAIREKDSAIEEQANTIREQKNLIKALQEQLNEML